jgi:hypothetical protein
LIFNGFFVLGCAKNNGKYLTRGYSSNAFPHGKSTLVSCELTQQDGKENSGRNILSRLTAATMRSRSASARPIPSKGRNRRQGAVGAAGDWRPAESGEVSKSVGDLTDANVPTEEVNSV